MRTFLAAEFSRQIKDGVGSVLKDLQGLPGIKWVEPENFHGTLKFLGPTPMGRKAEILRALRDIAGHCPAFTVSLEGVGCFPDWKHPRILWVGIHQGADSLRQLASAVGEALLSLGFTAEEREFSAHATLGRVKDPRAARPAVQALGTYRDRKFGQCSIDVITWFKSTLTPKGPVYEVLKQIPLKKS